MRALLLGCAAFGFFVPNGYFVYWLFTGFKGLGPVLQDHLAMGFILDAFMALGLLSAYFAKHPIGKVGWRWFVLLSLLGGLGFSLPFYWWLNIRDDSQSTSAA